MFVDVIDTKRVLREIVLLRKLRHPYVVELIEILEPKSMDDFDTIYVVMEYAESDLKNLIKSSMSLELIHIQTIVYNIICALKYLNESNVIHRDIKPANILIYEDCKVKLCDFGLARSITGIQYAPLILQETKHDKNNGSP